MPKSKSIEPDELLKLLNEYRLENPGRKVAIPDLGNYIRNRGHENIKDYTLRRCDELRKAVDEVNKKSDEAVYNELVVYRSIDLDAFLKKNNTREKLRIALAERDGYYSKVSSMAAEAIKAKKEIETENKELRKKIEDLENKLESARSSADIEEIKKKEEAINGLKNLLYSYVYPEVANRLMEKEGILETVNGVIDKKTIEEKTLKADEKIEKTRFSSVNKLMEGLDE